MEFEFCTAPRIVFGRGGFDTVGQLVRAFGRRALVVRGGSSLERADAATRLDASLGAHGVDFTTARVTGEPTIALVDRIASQAREAGCEVVVGLGGGSAIDAAKAVSALAAHGTVALDHLEVVGQGRPIPGPGLPLIAVPTTAGTGAEVTRNAVLTCEEQSFKASMRSSHLLARVALVDPSLMHSVPPDVTASTGLDALTQVIESGVCTRANPMTDALARTGVGLASRSLRRAVADGTDPDARDDMALCALLSGMCLANSGLGAVHGFAAPLGAAFPVPHGVACAALLPHVMRANVQALREQDPDGAGLGRYGAVSEAWLGRREATAEQTIDLAIEAIAALTLELEIPRLSSYGVDESAVARLVDRARRASSMRANPVVLPDAVLADCLRRAL